MRNDDGNWERRKKRYNPSPVSDPVGRNDLLVAGSVMMGERNVEMMGKVQ